MARTICAIATAPATAALGLIRISGPDAFEIVGPLLKNKNGEAIALPQMRRSVFCRVADEQEVYDEVIAVFYKGPHSYTGEDSVELSCHGGLYVLNSILTLLIRHGCKLAEPGAFSKRAFLNGKLDLVRAQAVIDLIEAQSRAEQKNALSRMDGRLSGRIRALYQQLIDLNSTLLAYIDFPEEIEEPEAAVLEKLKVIRSQLGQLLEGSKKGRLIEEGLQIAIVGAPNAGKSTLLNQLLGYERSIVSARPGTTRDMIAEGCRLGDLKCRLADTAGMRRTQDPIELQGITIAKREAEAAQVVFVVFDGSQEMQKEDYDLAEAYGGAHNLAVINKTDLPIKINEQYIKEKFKHTVNISAQTGAGCSAIDGWIRSRFSVADAAAQGVLTSAMEIQRITEAKEKLTQAIAGLEEGFTPDLITIDLTEAASALGEVTGQTVTEQMIEQIFSRFCVGK